MGKIHIRLLNKEKENEEKDVVAYCSCSTEQRRCDPDGDNWCQNESKCFSTTP